MHIFENDNSSTVVSGPCKSIVPALMKRISCSKATITLLQGCSEEKVCRKMIYDFATSGNVLAKCFAARGEFATASLFCIVLQMIGYMVATNLAFSTDIAIILPKTCKF